MPSALRGEAGGTEEFIDGVRGDEEVELAGGVGPLVLFRVTEENGARGTEGEEAMLVEGELVDVVVEKGEGIVEQWERPELMILTVSAPGFLVRLGAVPPQPAWWGMTRSMRSSNAAARWAALPLREWPTTAMRLVSMSLSWWR